MTYTKKQLPKYCRHKPSGRAFVRIGGKMHYLGKYGSQASRREYDRIIAEFVTDVLRDTPFPRQNLTTTTAIINGNPAPMNGTQTLWTTSTAQSRQRWSNYDSLDLTWRQ